ncbi:P-loop containing nucleoside triphosphate hydrolase protein, partial [Aureobasidium melanogenum]
MDAETETEQALLQQQQDFAAQLQAEDVLQHAEEQPFAVIEWQFSEASAAYMFSKRNGGVSPEEEQVFNQLAEQYEAAKARKEELEKSRVKQNLGGTEQRVASPPIFVQQDESDQDEEFGAVNASIGSKRKRAESSKDLPKISRAGEMTDAIKQSLKRLIADAPANKKQAAINDSTRVLHAIKQFKTGSVEYFGDGTWMVEGVVTPLKTHQLISAGWMNEQETSAGGPKGGMLADMMGLGKTLSSLTSMVHGKLSVGPKSSRTNLVVVPKHLKDQWLGEARKKTVNPSSDKDLGLRQIISYSSDNSSETQELLFKTADLVVATYTELSSGFRGISYPADVIDGSDEKKEKYFEEKIRPKLPAIFRFKFRAIYLDEGHLIRNPKTLCAKTCQKLISKYRWILSGTPMTNDPTDLYSALTFIRHPKVSQLTFKDFKDHYRGKNKNDKNDKNGRRGRGVKGSRGDRGSRRGRKSVVDKADKDQKKMIDFEWVATILHECMRSWKYEDELFGHPLTKIPEPNIIDERRDFSLPESVIYSVVQTRLEQLARERAGGEDDEDDDIETTKKRKYVAGLLMVLRQMTGHVLLIREDIFRCLTDEDMVTISQRIHGPKSTEQSDAEQSLDPQVANDPRWAACNHAYCYECLENQMCLAAEHSRGVECELCKRPVGQTINEAEHEKTRKPRWMNGKGKVIPSTKSSAVVNRLRAWRGPTTGKPEAKVVVFTSFKDSHKLMATTFKEEHWKFTALTSEMSLAERNESVCQFNTDPDMFIMLATNGVGGTGLNLMVAKYLINYDNYFNESTELQARGRVVRIGQLEQTTIVSLTAMGTVDEHVKSIKCGKIDNINNVMNATDKLTLKDLLKMLEKAKKTNDIVELDQEDGT